MKNATPICLFALGASQLSAQPIQWATHEGGNGHWYEAVQMNDEISWSSAAALAADRGGYLATLTSQEENDWVGVFVAQPLGPQPRHGPWIGLSQDRTGPGFQEPGSGWSWITGENSAFSNWESGEPNNDANQEHWAVLSLSNFSWNDVPEFTGNDQGVHSFLVEYNTDPLGCESSECTGPLSLTPSGVFATGIFPRNIAVGDLTGDGDDDAVVANLDGTLSIFLGANDGDFAQPISLPMGNGTFDVVLADFDRDGDLDIASANYGSNDAAVALNDGAGSFSTPVSIATGSNPASIFATDLDLDGYDDLLVANSGNDSIAVLINQMDGTFVNTSTFPVSTEPFDIVSGDLNDDGIPDAVVCSGTDDVVDIFLGLGTGTLVPSGTLTVGVRPWSASIGDVDQDGDGDILVANSRSDSVGILRNNGNASFEAMVSLPAGDEPRSIVLADIDGDCDLDAAIAKPGSEDEVRILLNDGSGSFDSSVSIPVPDGPASLAIADLDNDGDMDVLSASYEGGTLHTFANQCTPRNAKQWTQAEGGNGHWYSVVLVPEGITWREAKASAAAVGGYLATPTTEAENNWLFDNLVNDPTYWFRWRGPFIGGYQPPSAPEPSGLWQWITGEPWDYTAWFIGEPNDNNGTENILHYRSTGDANPVPTNRWNDGATDSTDRISYVIEWSQDCNEDGVVDFGQLITGELIDSDGDGIPDDCSLCNADLNDDGLLDLADLSAFVGAFVLQQPEADYNSDGYFDLADISGFISDFVAGCD